MKKTEKTYTNKRGYEVTVKTVETNFQDGFVKEKEIHPIFTEDDIGKFHLGYQKHISFVTDDPRVTRPFIFFFSLAIVGFCYFFYKFSGEEKMYYVFLFSIPFALFVFITGQMSITRYLKKKKEKEMNEQTKRKEDEV